MIPADPVAASPLTTSMAVMGANSSYGDITITDAAGRPVDPNASLSGMATIGVAAWTEAMTITDAAGNLVDPNAMLPSLSTIGGPSAGLGNLGAASPLGSLHSVLATVLEKGDLASAAMIQSIIASQNQMIDIWTAPSNGDLRAALLSPSRSAHGLGPPRVRGPSAVSFVAHRILEWAIQDLNRIRHEALTCENCCSLMGIRRLVVTRVDTY